MPRMAFSQQRLFENAWKELYPGMIERVVAVARRPGDIGRSCDQHHRHRFRQLQRAGRQRHPAAEGRPHRRDRRRRRQHRLVSDRSRRVLHRSSCPTFTSSAMPVIGGGIPKSASAANAKARPAPPHRESDRRQTARHAQADRRLLQHGRARLCVFALGQLPAKGRHIRRGRRRRTSPVDAPRELRKREADDAQKWFKTSRWMPLASVPSHKFAIIDSQ